MNIFKNRRLNLLILSFFVVRICLMLYGCANIARPSGGAEDVDAPVYERSNPSQLAKNVSGQEIEIYFDENVELEKAAEKVVVSPPQINIPIVSANGRRVSIELQDTLLPNTTYTIDFSDAIRDLNEGNALEDFTFSFSTGDVIDSLIVSGTVLEASNLEPVTGVYVGIQQDTRDSAFYTRPFDRVSKTNAYGRFSIHNVKPGSYRLYALKDANNSFSCDMPSEDIAFLDSIFIPSVRIEEVRDTIFTEAGAVDSVVVHLHKHHDPSDLILLTFNENKKNRYFEKVERLRENKITLYFAAPNDTLPTLKGLNFDATDWALIESSPTFDTISYWIKDSMIYRMDTLRFTQTYLYTDTLKQLVSRTDTLQASMRKVVRKTPQKKNKKDDDTTQVVTPMLTIGDKIASVMEIGAMPYLTFEEPLTSIDASKIRLEMLKDTLWIAQPMRVQKKDGAEREYEILAQYKPDAEYLLTIDSTAIQGLYGLHNNQFKKQFRIQKVEAYSNLLFKLTGAPDSSFVELLTEQDKPVRKSWVVGGVAKFIHVKPGTYYARIVLDENGNFLYDTGDFAQNKQPEQVFYLNLPLELRANWDVQQDWDIYATPLVKQKPLDITKNKPEEKRTQDGTNQTQSSGNLSGQNDQYGGGRISGGTRTGR